MSKKNPVIQQRIRDWVENNPSRWYTAKYADIRIEADVSLSSLYRYFPLIVARAANTLPSQVKRKRREEGGSGPWRRKLSDDEIAEIQRLWDEGHELLDIAFMTGKSVSQVEKYKPQGGNR